MGKWNDAEIERALRSMEVLIDTREKKWGHIGAALDALGCPYERQKLDFGDYSFRYIHPDETERDCRNSIVVERKACIDEICGNFTYGRARFEREFQRAEESGAKVHLLIEGADWEKVEGHAYVSRLHPAALEGNLFSWAERYGLRLWFCQPPFSGKLIYQIFRYHLREILRRETK